MKITPTDVSEITKRIQEILQDHPDLQECIVERSAEVNEIPGRCPWLCIYRLGVEYPIRTLGLGNGFRQQRVELMLYAQQADGSDPEECEERLEQLVVSCISALLSDPTLRGIVDTIDEFKVSYVDYDKSEAGYTQTAAITFTALLTTTGG